MGLNNRADVQLATVPISAAQLATANSSPIVVIPVTAGKIVQVLSAALIRTAGTIQVAGLRMRYADDTDLDVLAGSDLIMAGVTLRNASAGFSNALQATVEGKNIVLRASADNTGALATVTINSGGTGWSVNNTFVLGGDGAGTGRVTAETGGVATAVEILTGGWGHTAAETGISTFPDGPGADLVLDAATITLADSSGILSVVYHLISV